MGSEMCIRDSSHTSLMVGNDGTACHRRSTVTPPQIATFTGPGLQELLHSATVAICGGVTVDRLWHAVPSFPTVSEVWLHLLEAYGL